MARSLDIGAVPLELLAAAARPGRGSEAVEEPLECRRLQSRQPAIDDPKAEIIELRQTLAARAAARRGRGPRRLD